MAATCGLSHPGPAAQRSASPCPSPQRTPHDLRPHSPHHDFAQGYEVFDAKTGEETPLSIRDHRFDLVLLDMNMPGMGGLAACREIRAGCDAAIIMLTVRQAEGDNVAALDADADDYITKPFGVPELLARIRAVLRRLPTAQANENPPLQLDGIVIDLAARRVRRGAEKVRLTPKVFDLLHYLLSTPHVAIPHTKLRQAVWGPDYGDQVE